jgi:hypothetical protein
MSDDVETRRDGGTVTVRVPMTFCRRGGRKAVVTPDGAATWAPRPRVDNTMVKALARAHRWKRMLESGEYASLAELAAAEKINPSYLTRVLRLAFARCATTARRMAMCPRLFPHRRAAASSGRCA